MAAPRPGGLQGRVLKLLEDDGPIPVMEISRYLRDVDPMSLDVCLSALVRVNKIARNFGKYELVAQPAAIGEGGTKTNTKPPPSTPRPPPPAAQVAKHDPPPSAEEEAKAALQPLDPDPVKPRRGRPRKESPAANGAVADAANTGRPPTPLAADPAPASAPAGKVALSFRESVEARRLALLGRIDALESDLQAVRCEAAELDQLMALAAKHGVAA